MTPPALSSQRVGEFLFYPFVRVAGLPSLLLGLAGIALAGGLGFIQGLHFDGVLDVHVGAHLPWWMSLGEGLINWLSLAVLLFIAGKIVSRTRFRAVDLFGTQALARWPVLLVSLMCLAPGFHRYTEALVKVLLKVTDKPGRVVLPPINADTWVFGLVMLGMLSCTVWMVTLLWQSFAHSCNARGGKAVAAFVVSLLLAEILSKVLIVQMLIATHS